MNTFISSFYIKKCLVYDNSILIVHVDTTVFLAQLDCTIHFALSMMKRSTHCKLPYEALSECIQLTFALHFLSHERAQYAIIIIIIVVSFLRSRQGKTRQGIIENRAIIVLIIIIVTIMTHFNKVGINFSCNI